MKIPSGNNHSTLFRIRKLVFLVTVNLAVLVALISVVELISYLRLVAGASGGGIAALSKFGDTYCTYEPNLGYGPYPSTRIYLTWWSNVTVIKHMRFDTDAYSRRVTPVDDQEKRDNSILFFGCSFTFGEGVKDDESLPACVGRLASTYMPYNYGFNGYGTQQMLARLQAPDMVDQVRHDNRVIVIYTFLDWHICRTIGNLPVYMMWGKDMPYYCLDRVGSVVRRGSFRTGRPVRAWLYDLLGKSRFVWSIVKMNDVVSEKDVQLDAMIIRESRDTVEKKFKNGDFYVMLYPGQYEYRDRLIRYLKMYNIKYLDYTALFTPFDHEHCLSDLDSHPTPQAYREVAAKLVADLRIGSGRAAARR